VRLLQPYLRSNARHAIRCLFSFRVPGVGWRGSGWWARASLEQAGEIGSPKSEQEGYELDGKLRAMSGYAPVMRGFEGQSLFVLVCWERP
jgi:hypothetical protein